MLEDLVSNRKAFHHYEILDTVEAGIVLLGTEIKSLRDYGGHLQDAYVIFHRGEAWLKNSSIAPYRHGNIHNHPDKRERKLLLHKHEIIKLKTSTEEKGLTVIPLALYLSKGIVKVRLAIARGKKAYDKRAAIKSREDKRSIDRAMKHEEA